MTLSVKLDLISEALDPLLSRELTERLTPLISFKCGRHSVLFCPTNYVDEGRDQGEELRGERAGSPHADFTLSAPARLPTPLFEAICEALAPMSVSWEVTPDQEGLRGEREEGENEGEEIKIRLTERVPTHPLSLKLTSDSAEVATLAQTFEREPSLSVRSEVCLSREPRLIMRAVPHNVRRRLQWFARVVGISLPFAYLELAPPQEGEDDIELHLPSEQPHACEVGSRLQLVGDDFSSLFQLSDHFKERTASYLVTPPGGEEDDVAWFELNFGALSYHSEACARLAQQARTGLTALGVDLSVAPLTERLEREVIGWEGSAEGLESLLASRPPRLTAPFKRYNSSVLFSASPHEAGHWRVRLYTDNPERCAPLVQELKGLGFIEPEIVEGTPSALTATLTGSSLCPDEVIEQLAERTAQSLSLPRLEHIKPHNIRAPQLTLTTERVEGAPSRSLELRLPLSDLNPVRHRQRLSAAAHKVSFKLSCHHLDSLKGLWSLLSVVGFQELTLCEEAGDEQADHAVIRYGGAPKALVRYLQAYVERSLSIECVTERAWGSDDMELWLTLPDTFEGTGVSELTRSISAQMQWFPQPNAPQLAGPLLSLSSRTLTVGDLTLERPTLSHELDLVRAPLIEEFTRYCLDQETSETLYHIAEAVALNEPCLIEGPTSASKTSAILYLAALLGQPVARLNLSAQTDTGELVGRFTPDEGGWAWRDGLVVQALKRGWWLIFDELNLAEPQILERLNPLLERAPSLTLSERDGRLIGGGGEPVHERFRVFATMNPSEYVGRAPLSPAYRDRWRAERHAPQLSERSLMELITHHIWGAAPDISLCGLRYEGRLERVVERVVERGVERGEREEGAEVKSALPLSMLASLPCARPFTSALARFHAGLNLSLTREHEGARGAGAPPSFTRRSLLSLLDYLRDDLEAQAGINTEMLQEALNRGVWRYYVSRLRGEEEVSLAQTLYLTSGLADLESLERLEGGRGLGEGEPS